VSDVRRAARGDRSLLHAPQWVSELTDDPLVVPGEPPADREATLALLTDGDLEVVGRLTDATNATFVCRVTDGALGMLAVYKPRRGERPLDDFPIGTLGNRERAAYLVSDASGWDVVPATIVRDGPVGPGALQAWIDIDETADVLEMVMTSDRRLRAVCLFDAIVNNADRKGTHLLPVESGHIYGVDHGICFSRDPKLRTVLWAWRGTRIEPGEMEVIQRVRAAIDGELGTQLRELLSEREVQATIRRTQALIDSCSFPEPDPTRPAVPWPPF
jgi:uncharacterized repeat protein (TIGR03843 family)